MKWAAVQAAVLAWLADDAPRCLVLRIPGDKKEGGRASSQIRTTARRYGGVGLNIVVWAEGETVTLYVVQRDEGDAP